jgi:hypothetical protein
MDDYANRAGIDVRRIITDLHLILTGPAVVRLNVSAAAPLAADITQQLKDYNAAMAGLDSVRSRDFFGSDSNLRQERLAYFRQQSGVETYCSTELVGRLRGIVDALPNSADAKAVADQIEEIMQRLNPPHKVASESALANDAHDAPRGRTVEANVAPDTGDTFSVNADEVRNPTPDSAPPAGTLRGVDWTLVGALQTLVVETMDRMIKAQQYLQHFNDPAYKAPPGRDDRAEREMPKAAPAATAIKNQPAP